MNDGLLYGFSHYVRGRFFCLDPVTGEVLWEGPPRTGQNVTFLPLPGFVAALSNNGDLQIVRADGERFSRVAFYRGVADRTWAPPVLLPQGALNKDHDRLTLWSLAGQ